MPGLTQGEGIYLSAFNLSFDPNSLIADGHLASFVYTAEDANDIELSILNIKSHDMSNETVYPTVESILIHQVASQQMMGGGGSSMMAAPMSMSLQTEQLLKKPLNIDETISFLEMIYRQDEGLQNSINESQWQDFINNFKD